MADTIDNEIAYDEQQIAFDANDPEVIESAKKSLARLKAKEMRFVESAMSSEDGRAYFFQKIMGDCHAHGENPMHDALQAAKYEGERGIGLRMIADILIAAPEQFWVMKREADERARYVAPRS